MTTHNFGKEIEEPFFRSSTHPWKGKSWLRGQDESFCSFFLSFSLPPTEFDGCSAEEPITDAKINAQVSKFKFEYHILGAGTSPGLHSLILWRGPGS